MPAHRLITSFPFWFFSLVLAGSLPAATTLTVDAVEPREGWQIITNGGFSSSAGGLVPAKGESFFNGINTRDARPPGTNRGAARIFSSVSIEPGTYELEIAVGKPEGVDFVNNLTVLLLADTGKSGAYSWGDRIVGALKQEDRPLPADGGWARWRYQFVITAETRTAGQKIAAGAPLGVMVLSNVRPGAGFAFDDLVLTRLP